MRVVQASTSSDPVTVTAAPQRRRSSRTRRTTTVSPYADVQGGHLEADRDPRTASTTATRPSLLKAGQIASVFVLDDASGGIVLRRVLDSASVGGVPKGYLATGGGLPRPSGRAAADRPDAHARAGSACSPRPGSRRARRPVAAAPVRDRRALLAGVAPRRALALTGCATAAPADARSRRPRPTASAPAVQPAAAKAAGFQDPAADSGRRRRRRPGPCASRSPRSRWTRV